MKFLKELIINLLINAGLLYIVSEYIPSLGFQVSTSTYNILFTFLILGSIFRFLNTIIKKILQIVTIPLRILTLGLSSILVNISIFYLFKFFINGSSLGITIQLGAILNVFILSIAMAITYFLIKKII